MAVPLVGPVVAVVAAMVAALTGRETLAVLIVVLAAASVQGAVLSGRFRRALFVGAAVIGRSAGRFVALIALLPVFGVLSLAGRCFPSLGGALAGPGRWETRPATGASPTRLFAGRDTPAIASRGHVRRAVIGAVVGVLVVQAVVGVAILEFSSDDQPETGGVAQSSVLDSAALRDLPWADEAAAEMGAVSASTVFVPYTGLALRDFVGRYVNVERRERRSYETRLGGPRSDVWFFGGSTMFGFDLQRDDHTIPSELVRLAEADGVAIEASNFGAPGYVNYQETVLLQLLLAGGQRPDVVVFYDGINDVSAQLLNIVGQVGPVAEATYLSAPTIREVLAGSAMLPAGSAEPQEPLMPEAPSATPLSPEHIIDAVIRPYRAGVDLAQTLGDRFGFDVLHYWQPDLYSKDPLAPGEIELFDDLDLDDDAYATLVALNERIRAALPPGTIDVSHALDRVDGPVLADVVHLNETGGRAVAEAMAATLIPVLRGLQDP